MGEQEYQLSFINPEVLFYIVYLSVKFVNLQERITW